MHWWNDFLNWSASDHGWRIISGAIVPFVAIIVAGVIAALIGRGATKRVVTMQEREARNAAVAAIISAARKAAAWGSLTHDERAYADHLAEDADVRLRLLPVPGSPVAANWAQHQIADIKKNSSTFSFQAEQSLEEFRDRMLDWQGRPSRARKLFRADLERWKFETSDANTDSLERSQQRTPDAGVQQRAASEQPETLPPLGVVAGSGAAASGAPSSVVAGSGAAASGAVGSGSAGPSPAAGASQTGLELPETLGTATARFPLPRPGESESTDAGRQSDVPAPTESRAYRLPPARSPLGSSAVVASDSDGTSSTPDADANDRISTSDRSDTAAGQSDSATVRPSSSITIGASTAAAPAPVPVPPVIADRRDDSDIASPEASSDDDESPALHGELTEPKVDAATGSGDTNTTSVPTRIADAPVEPADPDETNEAPFAAPLSASELRRRAQDEED
jgi:hypothetical protein